MKKLSYFLSLACGAMMFAGCSSDADDFVAENQSVKNELLTIGASLPGDNATRLEFQDNLLLDLRWSTYDQIFAETAEYGRSAWRIKDNIPGNGDNTTSAIFEGTIAPMDHGMGMEPDPDAKPVVVDPSTMITFVRYGWHDDFNANIYKYNSQRQKTPNVTEDPTKGGIGHWVVLKSDPISYANLQAKKENLVMKPANSILKINIKNLPDVVKNGEDLFIKYYNNFVEGSEQEPNATVELMSKITPNEDNFIYMAFDPANDLTAKNNIAFEIQSGIKTVTAYANSTEGVNYEPGKIYTVTLNYGNSDGLTWLIPAEPVYEKVFDDINGWTPVNDIPNDPNWKNCKWYLQEVWVPGDHFNTVCGYGAQVNDTYFVCDKNLTLDANANYIEIEHNVQGISDEDKPLCTHFLVRKVGATEWTEVKGFNYNTGNGKYDQTFVKSGKVRIEGFDGQDVQIAFMYNINNDANAYMSWYIKNIKITKE